MLTCSFGGSPIRLDDGPLAGRAWELNVHAADLAREAGGDDILVAAVGANCGRSWMTPLGWWPSSWRRMPQSPCADRPVARFSILERDSELFARGFGSGN